MVFCFKEFRSFYDKKYPDLIVHFLDGKRWTQRSANKTTGNFSYRFFHSILHTTMDEPQPIFNFIYKYVDEEQFKKYFRLIIIVCVYLFFRTWYTNWAKTKEIARRIEEDNRLTEARKSEREAEATEKFELLDNEAATFGWGKATRRNVKRQEHVLNEAAEQLRAAEQSTYDAAEDHDIEDLLEE